jgi:hypothetical protein
MVWYGMVLTRSETPFILAHNCITTVYNSIIVITEDLLNINYFLHKILLSTISRTGFAICAAVAALRWNGR